MKKTLLLTLLLLTLLPALTYAAAPTPAQRARAALAVAFLGAPTKTGCGCGCSDNCTCRFPGDCGSPACSCGVIGKHALTLGEGMAKAVKENKPILLWVREVCPSCEAKMPGYVHVHLTEYQGDKDLVTSCCVIVGKPDGDGAIDRKGTLLGIPTREQVEAVVNLPLQKLRPLPWADRQSTPPRFQFTPSVSPTVFGGFMGVPQGMGSLRGFGGGGGGRGGC